MQRKQAHDEKIVKNILGESVNGHHDGRTARPGLGEFSKADVISMKREPLRDGQQKITVRTAKKPAFAGVDPYNYYIDRNSDDNVKDVTAG